jgi:hypothetical protein
VSGKSSRDKGKRGEREFAGLVNNYLGYQAFERNIGQTRSGGYDLITHLPVAIEVKRQERINLTGWIKQAMQQAEDECLVPCVAWRRNTEGWRVAVIMTVSEFSEYVSEWADEVEGKPLYEKGDAGD